MQAAGFEYPEHLRGFAAGLPALPGVYIFHGEGEAGLPLYIGKSVNLRSRVLAHLRNADEARMLQQARRISHIRTAGEIGALLLESRLIKEQQPLYNRKLRRTRQLCALRLKAGAPEVVHAREVDFATTPDLFGLFGSRQAALEWLHTAADAHRLCGGALGLEKLAAGRPCFRAMVHRCAGACRGDEPRADHDARLMAALEALRVVCWPYPGAVGLVESDGELHQIHVVHHWCYLGSVDHEAAAIALARPTAAFDADSYKILCRPLLTGAVKVIALQAPGQSASSGGPRRATTSSRTP